MSVDFANATDVIEVIVPGQTQVLTLAVPGIQGPPGKFKVGTVITGAPGTSAAISTTLNAQDEQVVNFTIPRGDVGAPNTLAIGTVTTGTPGTTATASITGTAPNQTLSLTIPRGDVGATGPAGTITSATASSLAAGSTPTVTLGGTATARTFAFGIPTGATGATGPVNTIAIGTVTTGAPGSSATATITGTAPNQTLNLTIPQGAQGPVGAGAPDATNTAKGSIMLAGDLAGTADSPAVVATKTNTANALVRRNGSGDADFGRVYSGTSGTAQTPAAANELTRKDYVDASGTSAATPSTIMRRDNTGVTQVEKIGIAQTPTGASEATRKDYVDAQVATRAASSHTHLTADISDSTVTGRSVLTAIDAAAARTAIGAGTGNSNLAIGTTSTTAKAGDYQPTVANISDATVIGRTVLTSIDAAAVRTAIGAGTSSLAIGTTSTTAKAGDYAPPSDGAAGVATMRTLGTGATQAAAGNDARLSDARTPLAHTHTAVNISDSTLVGRSVLTAVDATAARTAIGAGTGNSNLAIGTTNTTAKAGDYQPTAANISDSTVTGRSVLTAVDATAARTAIGAGTSNLAIGTTAGTAAAGNDTRLSDARTPTAHTHSVTDLTATGTKSATTFLRGDNTWAAPAGGEGAFVVDKTLGNGSSPAAAGIQAQLDAANAAGGGRVYVPNGTYMIGTTLTIGSNTWLQLDPSATLRRAAEINSLLVNKTSGAGGYGGATNIRVSGGVWDGNQTGFTTNCTLMGFGHADGVTVEDATLRNLAGFWHLLEMNAVRRGRVLNCLFDGLSGTGGATAEMMQLDLAMSTGVFPWFGPYDNTPCDDFTISGCTFRNGQRGFGSHSQLAGFPHTKVRVLNNHFENFTDVAITPLYTWDLVISGNTGRECRSFVVIDTPDAEMRNIVISDNVFMNETIQDTANGRGIFLQGGSVAARVILDVVISNNVLRGMGKHGIGPDFCDSVTVIGNNIKSTGTAITGAVTSGGIWMYRVSGGRVIGNRVAITGGASTSADAADIIIGAATGAVGDTNKIIVADNHASIYRANAMCTDVIEHDNQWTTRTLVAGTTRYQVHHNLTGTTWTA